jgi:hypothetical protein
MQREQTVSAGCAPEQPVKAVPVTITKLDGSVVRGRVLLTPHGTLEDAVNGGRSFVTLEVYGGGKALIAKEQILSIEASHVPKPSDANAHNGSANSSSDPYDVLGVPRGAPLAEVRRAYHRLAKLYRPDRHASALLTNEVNVYLASMERRVNAAYATLCREQAARGSSTFEEEA